MNAICLVFLYFMNGDPPSQDINIRIICLYDVSKALSYYNNLYYHYCHCCGS